MNRKEPLIKTCMEGSPLAHGHRPKGVTMIAARKADDANLLGLTDKLPILEGKFEGNFDRVRAVVAKETARKHTVRKSRKLLGKFSGPGVI